MLYNSFDVTGVANVTTLDEGLVSLVEEQYRIKAILITVSIWAGNVIEGWVGTHRIIEIQDQVFDSMDDIATMPVATNKINRIVIDEVIPKGQIFKIGINCGAVATDIHGAYEYEIVK